MPRPNLIHPIWVTVERLDRAAMVMDDDAREPIHGARTSAAKRVRMPAQIKWDEQDDPQSQEGGVREGSSGYILCRIFDLDLYLGQGKRLERGDRIVQIGWDTGKDLYLLGNVPMGHYPSEDGASLLRYNFEDRKPSKQTGDL